MTVQSDLDRREWEYRNLIVACVPGGDEAAEWKETAPGFVEELLRTVEGLDATDSDGWRLVSVAVEEDQRGGCRLNARLKRARHLAAASPETPYPATIPLPQRSADVAQRPGTERAA